MNLLRLFKTKDQDDNTPNTERTLNADSNGDQYALKTHSPILNETLPTNSTPQAQQTYEESGFTMAGAHKGDINALQTNLDAVTLSIKTKHKNDKALQEKHRQTVQGRISVIKQDIANKEQEKSLVAARTATLELSIESKKEAISAIRKDPASVGKTSPLSVASLYIGATILAFLTIYLFIFYSSASYSAFFKVFTPDDDAVHQSIFDARAIPLAWEYGATALAFIILIPFVFLGLGYLIHKFQEGKQISGYIKASILVIITLIFDILLAYDIVKKIYEIRAANSFEDVAPYSLGIASQDVNFWIIIFAGFVVYLVWGFVFDFTMEAYADTDKVNSKIRALEKDIDDIQAEIDNIKRDSSIDTAINGLRLKLQAEENNLNQFYINTIDLKQELTNFFNGWIRYLNQANIDATPHYSIFSQYINQIAN